MSSYCTMYGYSLGYTGYHTGPSVCRPRHKRLLTEDMVRVKTKLSLKDSRMRMRM